MNTIANQPVGGKKYKLFLVEVDDEDRERVISGLVGRAEIDVHYDYDNVHSASSILPVMNFATRQHATLTLEMETMPTGAVFEVVNFKEAEEEE